MAKFKVKLQHEEREVEVMRQGDTLHVIENNQTISLRLVHSEGNAFVLERLHADGQRSQMRLAGHQEGDKRQLWVNGRFLSYERVRERGSSSAAADGSFAATIPAVVSQILVQVGDVVAEGDKLILLESMKMVIPIQAPYAGVVTAVLCQPGQSVPAGIPLLTMESQHDPGTR